MPFEPRLIRPDDGQGDGGQGDGGQGDDGPRREFPPDLEVLGEQLSADAAMLAERYPAELPELRSGGVQLERERARSPRNGGRRNGGRRMAAWWSVLAVAVAVVGGASWTAWQMVSRTETDRRQTVRNEVVPAKVEAGREVSSEVEQESEDATLAEADVAQRAVSVAGAESLLLYVSGPELEGVLDLMETQATDEPLLSI